MPAIEIYNDPAELAAAAARKLGQLARKAVQEHGRCTIALTGGSTPRALYGLIAQAPDAPDFDWASLQVCFGDERCVPPDHADSNYRMAHETLLGAVPIPAQNIHRMPGELPPEDGARAYEQTLRSLFPGQTWPRFDIILLGLGEDGHTASLFPGSPALDETSRWVTAVEHTAPPTPLVARLSLTFPVINAAAQVIFLVSGAAKQAVVSKTLFGPPAQPVYPAQRIRPAQGQLTWLLDRAAAGQN